jgi:large subunit ribosomal protein L9
MEVILRDDVANLGAMGEIVKVKPGYARNYLLPRGLAVEASRRNVAALEHEKRLVAVKRERERKTARAFADQLDGLVLEVKARAGEEDRLYGSVTNLDIEKLLEARGFNVDRRKIDLADPIKRLGTYRIPVGIAFDVKATITLKVLADA